MSGMMGGMVYGILLSVMLLLGFAYIVFVMANKESGWIKTTGQVIAVVITVMAVIIFLYSGIYGGLMGRGGKMGGCMMMQGGGMNGGMMDGKMMNKDKTMQEHMK